MLEVIARMNVGGPAVQVAELVRGLDPTYFDVRLATGWCADDESDYLLTRGPGLPAIRIPDLGRSVRAAADARALRDLVALLRDQRPHILHTHTAKAGALGRTAVRIAGTGSAVVHTFHGHLLEGYFDPRMTRAVVGVERALARRTDRIVTVGARVRDDLLAAGVGSPGQYDVIPPGIRTPAAVTRAEARRRFGIADDVLTIAVVGRLVRIKRPDRMADVIAALVDRGLPIHVLVAGGGDQEAALRRTVVARGLPVSLLGWHDRPGDVFAAADLALLTSDNEGTPVALVEAALLGVPAVACRVGAVPEVVADGVTGVLTAPDAAALAEAVAALAADPGLLRSMGDRAQTQAEDRFDVDRYLRAHTALFSEVVRARHVNH